MINPKRPRDQPRFGVYFCLILNKLYCFPQAIAGKYAKTINRPLKLTSLMNLTMNISQLFISHMGINLGGGNIAMA